VSTTAQDRTFAGTDVTALILAGGAGRRLGGKDKGLVHWHGLPLVQQVQARIAPQVADVLISCNRNRAEYAAIGRTTAPDRRAGNQGPLAGLEAALPDLQREFVLLVPCDMPLLPDDLVARLLAALQVNGVAGVCYPRAGGDNHYVCALLRRNRMEGLTAYLDQGGRAVRHWYASIGGIAVDFDDEGDRFVNLNTLE